MNIQTKDCRSLANAYKKHYCKPVTIHIKEAPFYNIEYNPLPVSELQSALQKNEPAMRAFHQVYVNYQDYLKTVDNNIWSVAYFHITKEMEDAYKVAVNGFDSELMKRLTS